MKNKLEQAQNKEYQWSPDWADRIAHSDINKVVSELKDIEETIGKVTTQAIVDSSKNKKSVLHSYFQWDNDKAANSFRLHQAAILLRHIEVKIIKDGQPIHVRVYETIKRQGSALSESNYKRFDILSPENILQVKAIIISDLRRMITKMSQFNDTQLAKEYVLKAIEELSKVSTETKKEVKPVLTAVV